MGYGYKYPPSTTGAGWLGHEPEPEPEPEHGTHDNDITLEMSNYITCLLKTVAGKPCNIGFTFSP
jgi:hypothetical protein